MGASIYHLLLIFSSLLCYSSSSKTLSSQCPANTSNDLLNSLHRDFHFAIINRSSGMRTLKIALGYNVNLDVVIPAIPLFNVLLQSAISDFNGIFDPKEIISTIPDLLSTFGYFFSKGIAAERAMVKETFEIIKNMTFEVANLESFDNQKLFIGGNAALMAEALVSRSNASVMLGGPIGPWLRDRLNKKIESCRHTYFDTDEFHIILEYAEGDTWTMYLPDEKSDISSIAQLKSPRANRFIVSYDQKNGRLETLEGVDSCIKEFNPDLIVITGLNILQGEEHDFRSNRLQAVAEKVITYEDPAIHFESASIGDPSFAKQVYQTMLPIVDSVGFNEQELYDIYYSFNGVQLKRKDFINPSPENTSSAILHILDSLQNKTMNTVSLSRFHFHYLHYHIVAITDNGKWTKDNAMLSVMAGSIATTETACSNIDVASPPDDMRHFYVTSQENRNEIGQYQLIHVLDESPLVQWTRVSSFSKVTFFFAPVIHCLHPVRTVGLGDTISGTALAYSM